MAAMANVEADPFLTPSQDSFRPAFNQPATPLRTPDTGADFYASHDNSAALIASTNAHKTERDNINEAAYQPPRRPWYSRPLVWLAAAVAIVVIVLVIVLPVELVKKNNNSSSTISNGNGTVGSGTANPYSPTGATSGANGSVVIDINGTSFTYLNQFGGIWFYDPNDPFNTSAQCNSWTPPLNTSWQWGVDRVFGVNLGGLFVLEPFIAPALFEKYPAAYDEWTLSEFMANDTSAGGGLGQIEEHYNSFIKEEDIAEIAGAGLNWVRLPIPFWAIETWDFEPFLEKVSWQYILRVLQWCRKYGIRVNLDLHTIPGSQNGYNHSGKEGEVNFLNGVMGIANAQRAMNYIRIIAEFISQPEWAPVIPIFSILNEPLLSTIGQPQIESFYLEAYEIIRNITGIGEGHGPYIGIHDGFLGTGAWAGFMNGSDRMLLDTHPYFAFDGQPNMSPIATGYGFEAGGIWPAQACNAWGPELNTSQTAFGVTVAGEFSNGFNACGLYLEGVNVTSSYTGACDLFIDASQWNETMKAGFMQFTLAQMDALQNYFFWTWKIGNATSTGTVQSPMWSYQLGLRNGWMPTDPRTAVGTCAGYQVSGPIFNETYSAWQTGGPGAGQIPASETVSYSQFPPAIISGLGNADQAYLYTYTATGTIPTLTAITLTPTPTSSVNVGNGWQDPSDTGLSPTEVAGCSYPLAWSAIGSPVPTTFCPSTATGAAASTITSAP